MSSYNKLKINQAALLDIEAKKGDTFYFKMNVKELDVDTEQYVDFIFANYDVNLEVKSNSINPFPVLYFTDKDGTIIKSNGLLELKQSDNMMDNVRAGEYDYDLQFYDRVNNLTKTYMVGKFIIKEDITDAN